MDRPGFEADRFHVMLREARTGATRALTGKWDRSVDRLNVAADGKTLLANADDVGQHALYSIDASTGAPRKLVGTGQVADYSPAQGSVVYALASLGAPADLYVTRMRGGTARRLTTVNQDVLGQRAMSEYEQFSFKGWNDETVYGYVMKPMASQPGTRYPIAFLVHGGPQASFAECMELSLESRRPSPGHGYGVVFIDFHGSPGYGQAFTDSISQDWGGKPLEDLQKGLAAALAKYAWLDGERACAARRVVRRLHDELDRRQLARPLQVPRQPRRHLRPARDVLRHRGAVVPEWENGGPYYEKPQNHEKFNPVDARHEVEDADARHSRRAGLPRAATTQGIATFTALQRRGIESRLLVFPDENHWVLKPANSVLWHQTVLDWLDAHLKTRAQQGSAAATGSETARALTP